MVKLIDYLKATKLNKNSIYLYILNQDKSELSHMRFYSSIIYVPQRYLEMELENVEINSDYVVFRIINNGAVTAFKNNNITLKRDTKIMIKEDKCFYCLPTDLEFTDFCCRAKNINISVEDNVLVLEVES